MIDIHTHILPGRDDGPADESEALRMAVAAAASGTRQIIATPHCFNGVHHSTREEILNGCRRLNKLCRMRGVPMEILPGAEIHLIPELLSLFDQGSLMTLNNAGRHILLELPALFLPAPVKNMIARFRDRGVTVILAHPERQTYFMNHPRSIAALVDAGARLQITAESLGGRFGRLVRKTARWMIDQGWVDWVASDGHSLSDRPAVIAPFQAELERQAGKKQARQILFENPRRVLNGNVVVPDLWDPSTCRRAVGADRRAEW